VPVRRAVDVTPPPPSSRRTYRIGSSPMASSRWSLPFDDGVIPLPRGGELVTLKDAAD